jgi:hypothetical protein
LCRCASSESGHDNDQNAWNRGTSNANLTWADHSRVDWHYIAPGKPMQNAFIESLNGRLRRGLRLEKKYQIFVSSTFRDLVEERQDTIKSILDLGHIPAGMEGFPAIDMEQLKYIKKVIDQCD